MGACFPMDPLSQRMSLVILVDETLNIGHQLGASRHATADSRASERGNSFAASSHHGGSRYAPRGNIDHRASPPAAVVEEGKLALARLPELESEVAQHDRVLHEFGDELDHERGVRRSLEKTVQRFRINRSDDRSESAISQLENERGRQALRDELLSARREILSLQTQLGNLVRDHKNLLGILERNGCIRPRKKPRADSTGGADQRKT
ncbi:unnamed protein product [Peronospora destructor]|uniref:Uncharacterized protein n=1 Tax=Peronospora destructor TaxID=86335 RepID=A0AAV0V3G1_9STRA|nr:unnamed protein product [Peronospora destructor]